MWIFPDRKALCTLLLPLAALAASGCDGGGDGTGGSGGDGGSGGTGGTGGDTSTGATGGGGSGGAPMECEGPGFGGNEPDVAIGVLTASVVDQDGMPAANTSAQVCGTDVCFAETTSAAGTVTVTVNDTLKAPAFKYGDGLGYAKIAIVLPAGDSDYQNVVTAKLPEIGTGDSLVPGASAKSGGITIDVPAGGTVEFDTLVYEDESTQTFRAAEIPLGADFPGVDPALGLDAVFGVAPLETVFCPAATVHIPNTPQYPAGADVEIFIQGLDVLQHWAPYGQWEKVSDGKVSADGSEIVTADGQGFPLLSTFGVRLAQ